MGKWNWQAIGVWYLFGGMSAMVYQANRASRGDAVWPGFRHGDDSPPQILGLVETILLWPAAVTIGNMREARAAAGDES